MEFARTRSWMVAVVLAALLGSPALAVDDEPAGPVLFDMDTLRFKVGEFTDKDKQKVPAGGAELVDGKVGKAVRFTFAQGSSGGFVMAGMKGSPEWDHADGFSFWVKGDGSKSFGGIELIDASDFGIRFGYCFPI